MLARLIAFTRLLMGLLLAGAASAAPLDPRAVPAPLQAWIGWALHDDVESFCPLRHDGQQRLCHWPSQLRLELDASGGLFRYDVRLFAPGWVTLPGDARALPREVADGGRAVPVLMHDGHPALWAAAGEHRIEGRFAWTALPESLRVPPAAGLVDLSINGRSLPHAPRDAREHIWLDRSAPSADDQAEHLSLRVFRLIDDDLPLQVQTRVQIDAGGEVREELIGPVLLPGLVALGLDGDLPARLEPDGRLRVQLRPGVWTITLTARSAGPLSAVAAPAAAEGWPGQEIWSLRMRPELRVVEASGGTSADPRQTGTPEEWQNLPAFLLEPGDTLTLDEKQRGNPLPEPDQLHLSRDLWLDFDGGGFSLQDRLSGRLTRVWRLDASAPITLGQVQLDGQSQLITRHADGVGVEVRHGQLDLLADSRVERRSLRLPASGWSTDLQSVELRLHLPPAWRLLAAPGADNVPDTWLSRWTLLDLFLVLITAIAALRLFGPLTAALTLMTLALTWHEPGAPRWTWLMLIAAIALLRALPASMDGGRLRRVVMAWQWVAVAALAFTALPYAVQQARSSLYPQLEPTWSAGTSLGAYPDADSKGGMAESAPYAEESVEMAMDPVQMNQAPPPPPMQKGAEPRRSKLASRIDAPEMSQNRLSIQQLQPNVLTQTGAGLPQWSWRTAQLSWSGPVTAAQDFSLWLLPPWASRLLGVISILLIALVAARWLGLARPQWPRPAPPGAGARAGAAGLALGLALIGLIGVQPAPALAAPDEASTLPTPQLLEQLRQRLIAPPPCLPDCGGWSRLALGLSEERLILRLSAEAVVDTALPLPVPPLSGADQGRIWQPQAVLLDERPADLARSDDGQLWLQVPAGRHEVVVTGSLAGFAQLQLPLPLKPARVEAAMPGWVVSGINRDGQADNALQLARERPATGETAEGPASAQSLPPLMRITRTLRLGLLWTAEASVERLGNSQSALVTTVQLLPGETVTGESVRVVGGRVQASFAPGQSSLQWTSRLNITPELKLVAGSAPDQFEEWRLDISPLWRVDFAGLTPVQHQQDDWWLSSFRPWPGEALSLAVARPDAVPGQVLTLDRVDLEMRPGARATDIALSLNLRSSQGGQHALPLPPDLVAQSLSIDGQSQPLRQENGRVILPLRPGAQSLRLELRSDAGLSTWTRTPALGLGLSGVNANLTLALPENRWVLLTGGPQLGPAVLFWGVLAVLLLVAVGLGRTRLTPLRTAHWVLLIIGLSQLPVWGAAVVAGWLFALALRGRVPEHWSARQFNLAQVILVLWTLTALGLLFGAVANGLLGTPDMQIAGNDSSATQLRWFQDRYADQLPTAWVLSVSIWFYRVLMLLWALWLANSLLSWLRWGWTRFSAGGLWRKAPATLPPAVEIPPTPGAPAP